MYNIIEIYWEIFGRNDLQRAHCSIYFSQLWWYKNVPILSPSSHRLHLNHQEPSGLVTRHLTRKIKEQFVFNLKSNPGFSANSFQTSKILVQTCLPYSKRYTFWKFCIIFVAVHTYRYCTTLFVF